jgi:multidrug efflux system membrane fusion protein
VTIRKNNDPSREDTMSRPLPFLPAALAAALVLAACGKAGSDGPPPGAAMGPPPVSVAAAIEKEIVETDEFPGRIEAIEAVDVRGRVTGYIEAVHFKPGAMVKKGDLLFTLDARPFQAEVARAEAVLAGTRAQLALARTELERAEALFADRATSKREFDDARTRVTTLESQTGVNQAALAVARLNLGYTRIAAPIAGRVSKAEVTAGNLVQIENPNAPVLTTIVSQDPIYVSFEANEQAYLKYVAKGRGGALQVQVGLADEAGFPHGGRLEFVDNRVDPASGTVRMRAVLKNPDGRFTPGLFARVKLGDTASPRRAVLVADRAIGTDQSKRFVLVIGEGNKAEYREVRIGRLAEGGLRVIESGLKAGETIVVNGLQRVRPGAPVTPQTVPMEARTTGGRPAPVAGAAAAKG